MRGIASIVKPSARDKRGARIPSCGCTTLRKRGPALTQRTYNPGLLDTGTGKVMFTWPDVGSMKVVRPEMKELGKLEPTQADAGAT